MGRFRIYPSKNSVVFSGDTDLNVGINEVLELWYGQSGATRAVFKWDWAEYSSRYTNSLVPAITASSITDARVVITNTYSILQSGSSVGLASYEMEFPSVSAQTQLHDFDEGLGYHHESRTLILTGIAHWFSATTILPWPTAGIAPGSTFTGITSVTREAESIVIRPNDTANTLAHLWSGHIVPDAYFVSLLKYTDAFEDLSGVKTQKRLFYSRNTHISFKPYVQIDWDDQVAENRIEVIQGVTTPLYLFVYSGGTLADPESVDSVTIDDIVYTTINKVSKGIYRYDHPTPIDGGGSTCPFNDVWAITFTGSLTGTITQSFTSTPITSSSLWSGDTILRSQPFAVSLPNLEQEYRQSDDVYVRIKFRLRKVL